MLRLGQQLRHAMACEGLPAVALDGSRPRGFSLSCGCQTATPKAMEPPPWAFVPVPGIEAEPGLQAVRSGPIVNNMVQYFVGLDTSFAALSDTTRRGVLEQLVRADATITDLAVKFHMTLTGMKKHVGVLERAGLVITEKVGRVRTCKLGRRRLEEEAMWIESYRALWDARFDELDKVVAELKHQEKADGRRKR